MIPLMSIYRCTRVGVQHHLRRNLSSIPTGSIKSKVPLILMTGAAIGSASYYLMTKDSKGKEPKTLIPKETIATKPKLVQDLPPSVPYLIIGGGTAAFAAVRSIRAHDPRSKVMVITREDRLPYMKPPLSKELWFTPPELSHKLIFRQFDGREKDLYFEKDQFYFDLKTLESRPNGGVAVVPGVEVIKVDASAKVVTLATGQQVQYGKCLIATGGEGKMPPNLVNICPHIKDKVMVLRNPEQFLQLQKVVERSDNDLPITITIVGGGFLGSELACALGKRSATISPSLKVVQVIPESGILAYVLPDYLSNYLTKKVRAEGATVLPQTEVQTVVPIPNVNDKVGVKLSNGQTIESHMVVVAAGLEVNDALAQVSSLETHPTMGGFVVNPELESRTDLFVAGDAACFFDPRLGRRRVEHHDHAIQTGRLAGENMTGSRKPYHNQSMFWSDLGSDLGMEGIGNTDSSLDTVAVFAQPPDSETSPSPDATEQYDKGVIFYLNPDKTLAGILMLNVFNRVRLARLLLKDRIVYEDLTEVAKLFNIHSTVESD